MEKESLYIKRTADGVEEYFPNATRPARITTYEYNATRMGSAPTIEGTLEYPECLDDEWTYEEYVEFNGEKFYVSQVPSSSKSNTGINYTHDITFTSERIVLDNIYTYDVVTESTDTQYKDRYRSNMTSFSFYGDINEFVARLNDSLVYSGVLTITTDDDGNKVYDGFYIVVDDGAETDSLEVSFEDLKMSEALQEIYNVYELPYYWVGKVCHVGEVQYTVEDELEYGYGNALLSVEKENDNTEMVDRITGYGGSTNLQYYYPNTSSAGTAIYDVINITEDDVEEVDLSDIIKYKSGFYDVTFTYYRFVNKPVYLDDLKTDYDLYDCYGDIIYTTDAELYIEIPTTGVTTTSTTWISVRIPQGDDCILTIANVAYTVEHSSATVNNGTMSMTMALMPFSMTVPSPSTLAADYIVEKGDIALSDMSEDYRLVFYFEYTGSYDTSVLPGGLTYLPSWTADIELSADVTYTYIEAVSDEGGLEEIVYGTDNDDYISYASSGITFADTSSIAYATRSYYISGTEALYADTDTDTAAAIKITDRSWITPASYLMPSIYRETYGAQRFYPAENETYLVPDSTDDDYYIFKNTYNADRPHEGITQDEDIYPTIKNVYNSKGKLIAEVLEFAYDEEDSDALTDDSDEDNPEYIHSYFYAKLRVFDGDFGFNLFTHASYSEEAYITLTSGNCSACTFQIAVEKEENDEGTGYNFYNPVLTDDEGNLLKQTKFEPGDSNYFGDYILPIAYKSSYADRQQDTQSYEVWVALKKDNETFGVVMPNVLNSYYPSDGDSFVLTGIELPQVYIDAAEEKLDQYLIQYMSENNEESFTYSITFSRNWIATHEDIAAQINENSLISVKYNGEVHQLYVSSYTCKADSSILYEITVELSEELTITQSTLRTEVEGIKTSISSTVTTAVEEATATTQLTLTTDSASDSSSSDDGTVYLSKATDDTAAGEITFESGIRFGGEDGKSISSEGDADLRSVTVSTKVESKDFDETNQVGFTIRNNNGTSYICCTNLRVWGTMSVNELSVRELSAIGGSVCLSPSASILVYVTEYEVDGEMVGWKCYYLADNGTTSTQNNWQVGDQARCVTYNIDSANGVSGNRGYWRCVIAVSDETECLYGEDGTALYDGQEFGWIVLSLTNAQTSDYGSTLDGAEQEGEDIQSTPVAGDKIAQWGHQVQDDDNSDELSRMNMILLTAAEDEPQILMYQGIYTFSLDGRCVAKMAPSGWEILSTSFSWSTGSVTVPNYVDMGEWTDGSTATQYTIWYYEGNTWRYDGEDSTTEAPSTDVSGWVQLTYNSTADLARAIFVELSLGGQMYYDETETVTLSVWDVTKTTEYTDDYTFSVERDSGDESSDAVWNAAFAANYDGGNTFTISFSDLNFVDGSRTTKFWVYATETETGEELEEEVIEY